MTRSVYQFYTREEAGGVVPNAEVKVFFAGGAEAPIYDAEIGGALIAQPLIATASGRAVFYIDPGIYDVESKDPVSLTTATFKNEEIGTSRESLIDDNQHAAPYSILNKPDSIDVNYDNTVSLLSATNVQTAIDEIARGDQLINDISQAYEPWKSVAEMQADVTELPVGKKVSWQGYYSESDGGSNWGVVKSGSHTDDGGSIFTLADGKYVEANLKGYRVSVKKFGAVGDNSADDTLSFQTTFDVADDLNFSVSIPQSDNKYRLTSPIQLKTQHDVKGAGMATVVGGLNFVNCNGFELLNSASRTIIKGVSFFQSVRFSDVSNSYIAIKYVGTAADKCHYNTVRDCFFDGFGALVECNYAWETTLDNLVSVFCGSGVFAKGSSVNNRLVNSTIEGSSAANTFGFLVGDGTNPIEGWTISNNVLSKYDLGVFGRKATHIYIQNNIFDFMVTGAIKMSDTSGNFHILNNYMAATDGGSMIDIDTVSPIFNDAGSKVCKNIILGYSSLDYGVRVRGSASNTLIDGNSVRADIADVYIEEANNLHKVVNNHFQKGGLTVNGSTPRVMVDCNTGDYNSTQLAIYKSHYADRKQTYGIREPQSGDFINGDIHWNITPGAVENCAGWTCITSGVAGSTAEFEPFGTYI